MVVFCRYGGRFNYYFSPNFKVSCHESTRSQHVAMNNPLRSTCTFWFHLINWYSRVRLVHHCVEYLFPPPLQLSKSVLNYPGLWCPWFRLCFLGLHKQVSWRSFVSPEHQKKRRVTCGGVYHIVYTNTRSSISSGHLTHFSSSRVCSI